MRLYALVMLLSLLSVFVSDKSLANQQPSIRLQASNHAAVLSCEGQDQPSPYRGSGRRDLFS